MVNSCCAHNCTARDVKETREAGIKVYRIPVKEPKRTLWLNAIARKDFNPKAHTLYAASTLQVGRVKTLCRQLTFQVYFLSLHLQKREEQNRVWNVTRQQNRDEKRKRRLKQQTVWLNFSATQMAYSLSIRYCYCSYPN